MHPLQSLQTLPPKPTQKLPTTHPPTWITNKNGNRDVRNPKESILIQIPPQILILPPIHLLLIHDPDLDPKKSKKKRKRKHRKRSSSYSSDESRTKHRKKSRRDRGSRRKRSRSRSYSSRSRSRGRSYSRSASRDKMGGNKPYNPSSRYTENAEYGYNDNNYGDSSYSRYGGGGGSGGFGGGRGGYRGYNGRGGGNNYYGGGGSGGSYGSRVQLKMNSLSNICWDSNSKMNEGNKEKMSHHATATHYKKLKLCEHLSNFLTQLIEPIRENKINQSLQD
eukprot:616546_1